MASLLTVDDVLRSVLATVTVTDGYTSGEDDSGANGGGDEDRGYSSNGGNAGGDGNGSGGIPQYLHQRGCTTDMTNRRPVDLFHLFVTNGMLEDV